MNADVAVVGEMQQTRLGTAVSGLLIFTAKREAQEYAKAQGWNKNDVRPVYHARFGWKGYVVGQLIDTTTFRGFAANDALVCVTVLPADFTKAR